RSFPTPRSSDLLEILLPDEGHRGRVQPAPRSCSVEALGRECSVTLCQFEQVAGWYCDLSRYGQLVQDIFPATDVPAVVARRKLSDPQSSVIGSEVSFRAGPSQ